MIGKKVGKRGVMGKVGEKGCDGKGWGKKV